MDTHDGSRVKWHSDRGKSLEITQSLLLWLSQCHNGNYFFEQFLMKWIVLMLKYFGSFSTLEALMIACLIKFK